MTALYHDTGIPGWLAPGIPQFDYHEERIAELVEAKRAVVALGSGWWLYPQVNMISDSYQQRIRCGYSAHNWHLYMRSGWYWAKKNYWLAPVQRPYQPRQVEALRQQNTGGMDTSGPPGKPRQSNEGGQGGNYRGVAQLEERVAHNHEAACSNRAPATRMSCQTDGLMTRQPVEGRSIFAGSSDTANQVPAQAGFEMGLLGERL